MAHANRTDKPVRAFRPSLQILEERTTPAGNVAAAVFDGILYIAGDAAANRISVVGAGGSGATVAALDADTTINGQSGPVSFGGIFKGYHIVAGAGDDAIQLNGLRARDTVNLDAGSGDDTVQMTGVSAGKGSIVFGGDGDDIFSIGGSNFGKLFSLTGGAGNDYFNLIGNSFEDNALFNGGAGTNTYARSGGSFAKGLKTNFAPGNPPSDSDTPPTDTTAPTASISASVPSTTNQSPFTVTVAFSEAVTGFALTDVTLTNATASNLATADSKVYTFSVTPTAQGSVTVGIPAGAATDAAGNSSTASNTLQFTFDSAAPSVTATALTTNDTTPTLTGTVSESSAKVQVTVNSQVLTATVSGTTWSVTVPTALANGTYAVAVVATDATGNSTTATANLVVDSTATGLALTTTAGTATNLASIPFTAKFDRDVTGFDATDIALTNGTISNFTMVDARTYTFNVSATGQGIVTVNVAADRIDGDAANGNLPAAITITYDTTAPTLAVAPTGANPGLLASIPFSVTFNEAVSGFDASDISATNGTVSGFTAVSPTLYSFNVTPTADGAVTVTVAAGGAPDIAGNANPAASVTVTSLRTDAGMAAVKPVTTGSDFVALGTEGLKTKDIATGTGTAVTASSTVTLFYSGWLSSDGSLFDSSRTTGSPAVFNLAGLIPGFRQAAVGMQPGGIRQVFIPAALAYGATGSGDIPPNADLVFEIKLLATT